MSILSGLISEKILILSFSSGQTKLRNIWVFVERGSIVFDEVEVSVIRKVLSAEAEG